MNTNMNTKANSNTNTNTNTNFKKMRMGGMPPMLGPKGGTGQASQWELCKDTVYTFLLPRFTASYSQSIDDPCEHCATYLVQASNGPLKEPAVQSEPSKDSVHTPFNIPPM